MAKILVLRNFEQGNLTKNLLESYSFKIDLYPISDITFPYKNISILNFKLFDNIIISSQNALKSLNKTQLNDLKNVNLFTINKMPYDFKNVKNFQNLEQLLKYLIDFDATNQKNLLLRGNYSLLSNKDKKFLTSKNFTSKICYKVNYHEKYFDKIRQNILHNQYSSILFYSKKSADFFISLLRNAEMIDYLQKIKIYCISSRVAKSFENINIKEVFIAKEANQESMIKLLLQS